MTQNRQWKLRARPTAEATREHFELVTSPVPSPAAGELLVAAEYVSLDPAMRGWLNDAKSYVPPVGIGEVMRAIGVGKVVESKDAAFAVGDFVTGMTGVQAFAAAPAKAWTKIDPSLVPLPRWLGIVGMPGMTAYFGLLDVGGPIKAGETLVVSAASGAVGAVVGQIGKIHGMRVVGIAGGVDKCRYIVDELGFDAAVDYKHDDVKKKLREACPQGIDVYFDNVGGEILDHALAMLRKKARVVICGAISQYNSPSFVGPKNYMSLLVNRARMEGFVVFDFAARYAEAAMAIARWHKEGKLKAKEDIVDGLEQFPEALAKLFHGENFGKLILKV
jgi:NADPH-dependent curcumin reductase CurA